MLSLVSVSTGYGGAIVNRSVSLDVADGEIVSLIGRNGVGKSTLAKTVIGLQRAISGSILFEGRDVTKLDARRRARLGLGYVPQGRGIFGDMTVEENLKMGRLIGGASKPIDYAFDLFPILRERRDQLGGTLSGDAVHRARPRRLSEVASSGRALRRHSAQHRRADRRSLQTAEREDRNCDPPDRAEPGSNHVLRAEVPRYGEGCDRKGDRSTGAG